MQLTAVYRETHRFYLLSDSNTDEFGKATPKPLVRKRPKKADFPDILTYKNNPSSKEIQVLSTNVNILSTENFNLTVFSEKQKGLLHMEINRYLLQKG